MKKVSFRALNSLKKARGNIHFGKIVLTLMLVSMVVLGSAEPASANNPLYYYDKYNSSAEYSGYEITSWDYIHEGSYDLGGLLGSSVYSVDSFNGIPSANDYNLTAGPGIGPAYVVVYGKLHRLTYLRRGEGLTSIYSRESANIENQFIGYIRGSLIKSDIIAEDGTYPANGRHTDGFWYIRKGLANSNPTLALTTPVQNSYFG